MNAALMTEAVRLLVAYAIEHGTYQPWNRPTTVQAFTRHPVVDVYTYLGIEDEVHLVVDTVLGRFRLRVRLRPRPPSGAGIVTPLSPELAEALDTMLASMNDTLTEVRYELGAIVFDLASGRAIECEPNGSYVAVTGAVDSDATFAGVTGSAAAEQALLRALDEWVDQVLADAVARAGRWPVATSSGGPS